MQLESDRVNSPLDDQHNFGMDNDHIQKREVVKY